MKLAILTIAALALGFIAGAGSYAYSARDCYPLATETLCTWDKYPEQPLRRWTEQHLRAPRG